jgi:hypothetical protein
LDRGYGSGDVSGLDRGYGSGDAHGTTGVGSGSVDGYGRGEGTQAAGRHAVSRVRESGTGVSSAGSYWRERGADDDAKFSDSSPTEAYPTVGSYSTAGSDPIEGLALDADWDERPRRPMLRLLAIAVPVFVAVTVGVVALLSDQPGGPEPTARVPDVGDQGAAPEYVVPTDPRKVSAPLDGRTEASFDLITGTSAVSVRVADLGDDLYRISTPAGSDTLPRPRIRDDRVQLQLVPSGEEGPGAVDVELNSEVRWRVRMTGGATEHLLDLAAADLSGVELLGGATRVELTLPPPDGTLYG